MLGLKVLLFILSVSRRKPQNKSQVLQEALLLKCSLTFPAGSWAKTHQRPVMCVKCCATTPSGSTLLVHKWCSPHQSGEKTNSCAVWMHRWTHLETSAMLLIAHCRLGFFTLVLQKGTSVITLKPSLPLHSTRWTIATFLLIDKGLNLPCKMDVVSVKLNGSVNWWLRLFVRTLRKK